jgi:hypothetical protein
LRRPRVKADKVAVVDRAAQGVPAEKAGAEAHSVAEGTEGRMDCQGLPAIPDLLEKKANPASAYRNDR